MFIHIKRISIFLGICAGIVILVLMINFGQADNDAINATWNKLKPNDSVYAAETYIADTGFVAVPSYRLIRPLKEEDVKRMSVPSWQKLKMIAQLDTTAEHARPVMIESKLAFMQDLFFKKGTACIGTYIKSDSTTGAYKETIYIPLKWHAINPNTPVCDFDFKFEMPKNYTFADSNYYVSVIGVSLKQSKAFILKKQ